jgi:predicted nuclease with RNAse H fold
MLAAGATTRIRDIPRPHGGITAQSRIDRLVVMNWLGVDVGGPRKGFDVALIDDRAVLVLARLSRPEVVEFVVSARPQVVGIDGPRTCALPGETSRADERALARAVCGIRWTPDRLDGPYYAWVVEGLRLYDALAGHDVIEVFPTASWTRWLGPRGAESRAAWTRRGVAALGLAGVPDRTNQDQRDAIAAAVTARAYTRGETEAFGEIVVPG